MEWAIITAGAFIAVGLVSIGDAIKELAKAISRDARSRKPADDD